MVSLDKSPCRHNRNRTCKETTSGRSTYGIGTVELGELHASCSQGIDVCMSGEGRGGRWEGEREREGGREDGWDGEGVKRERRGEEND